MAQQSLNMNAMCYCDHRLSQHTSKGHCGLCKCDKFTEKLTYRCEVCNERLSILEAPNDDVVRLSYTDNGRNYAHTKCLPKRKQSGLGGQKKTQEWAKGGKLEKLLTFSKLESGRFLTILARFGVVDEELSINHDLLEQGEEVVLIKKIVDYLEQ